MSQNEYNALLYLAPIFVSWLVTFGLGVLAYRRRRVTGALPFAITMGLEAQWIGGYILGLLSSTLEGKIFWENFQYLGTLLGPLMILVFALEYCGHKFASNWKLQLGLALPALIVIILSWTNPWHHLALLNQRLIPGDPFDLYGYDFGLPVYAVLFYCYALMIWAVYLLARQYLRQHGIYRRQTGFVLAGIIIPLVSSVTIFLDLPFLPQRDISPYYFSVADIFIAYGLFHYRLFDIVPFARDMVMEHMEDGVLIVDPSGRLLDINLAARNMLAISTIGQPLTLLLPGWVEQAELSPQVRSHRKEIPLNQGGELKTIDLRITRLPDQQGQFSGHMLILRDITARKRSEDELRRDQDVLEQRVSLRTADLAAANERLQAEVEQRRRTEQEKEIQRSEMEILYRLTVELAGMPVDADLEGLITTRLKELTGAFVVVVSEYNPEKKQLEQRRMETDSSAIRETSRLLGRSVTELVIPLDDRVYAQMVNSMVGYFHSLSEATFGAIPAVLGAAIQKLFNLDVCIGLAAQYQGELMGSCMLVLRSGQPPPSQWLMDALANLLSIIYRRRRAEAQRLESENRFQALAEMLPQPIYECDLSGQITYVNRKALEVFGYQRLEPGLFITDIVVEADHEKLLSEVKRLLDGIRPESHMEYKVQRKDGSTFPVLVYSAPIVRAGRPLGLRGVLVDFTELKASEEALRSSEEKFRSVIEQASDGVILVGEDGLVLELNQAFEQIYGISRSELLGKPFWEMTRRLGYPAESPFDPQTSAQKNYEDIVQGGSGDQAIVQETEFITPDGRRRVIQRTAFPVTVSQGRRMAAVVSDITERKNAEQEQRRLNRTLTMISECNQALVRMDDEKDLLQAICKIMVEIGVYRFAWIGSIREAASETAAQEIQPFISYGEGGDYLEKLAACREDAQTRCLSRFILEGIRSAQPTIFSDIRTDPAFAPYRVESIQHGFLSVIILPLKFGSELFGSLNIYRSEPYVPDQAELGLITEMVNDVSYGIHARRMRIARDLAEQKAHEANQELNRAYESTLEGWSRALGLRERETAGHSQRVVSLTLEIARRMGLAEEELVHIRRGALLHDIGKMGIPDHILLKPESLNDEEWAIMRQHPLMAYKLLADIPYLAPVLDIPYYHHEWWNGSGYPHRLSGEEIPLAARIFAVVDVWDALMSDRPYRSAWSEAAVMAYLKQQAGRQFDPRVVAEFLAVNEEAAAEPPL